MPVLSYPWLVALSAVKMLLAFLLVFVYLPRHIFPQRAGATPCEQFIENLVLMTCASLVIVQTLSLLQIYNSLSLAIAYVSLYLGIRRYSTRKPLVPAITRSATELTLWAFRSLDGLVDFRAQFRSRLGQAVARGRTALSDPSRDAHVLMFLAILGIALWYRAVDPFVLAPFSASDSYYHLEAIKRLAFGEPFWIDLSPKGFHAFVSVLHQVTWVDPVLIVKLSGPLSGILIVLSVYWAAFRLTRDRNAALVAMLMAAIVDGWSSRLFDVLAPGGWAQFFGAHFSGLANRAGPFMMNDRQTSALPQEFAMIFILPAFFLGHTYMTERSGKRDLVLLFAAVTIVVMSHWIVAVAVAAGLTIMVFVALLRPVGFLPRFARATAACALAAVVGSYQFVAPLVHVVSARADSVQATYASTVHGKYGEWLDLWRDPLPVPPVLYVALAVGGLALVYGVLLAGGAVQRTAWIFSGLLILVLLFESRAINFGVLYLIPPDQTGKYLGLVLPIVVGGLWSAVTGFRPGRSHLSRLAGFRQVLTALVLVAVVVVAAPASFGSAARYEYRSLAEMYFEISRKFRPLEWTIVSNVEDYSKSLARGWHINASDFLNLAKPADRKVAIPTPYVFIFVEKKPLEVSTSYQTPLERRDVERRLAEWVFTRNALFNDVSLYFEDGSVLVYLLRPDAAG